MEFVHPEILWGLGALTIPIVIHLLHFRRFKRIAFSQVAFLNEIRKDTRATQQIKHWWILFLRLLALAAIIVAFAQPKLGDDKLNGAAQGSDEGHVVSIYVDNSHSMEAVGEEGQLFQSARNKAALVIEQFNVTDRFHILTNDFSGKDQRLLTQDQALKRLESIHPSHITRKLADVMQRITGQLSPVVERTKQAYVFSDLQKSTHEIDEYDGNADSTIQWYFLPELAGNAPNIWVDSVWFDEPMRIAERPATLRLRLKHNSNVSVNAVPMGLHVNGERLAAGTFNLLPGLHTDTVLRYTHGSTGLKFAALSIEDAPIRFDDVWNFGYEVTDEIRVLVLTDDSNGEAAKSLERLFDTASGLYRVSIKSTWNSEDFNQTQLVVLSDWSPQSSGFASTLASYAENGGTAVYLPSPGKTDAALLSAWGVPVSNNWINEPDRVTMLTLEHPFFQGMFDQIPARMDLPELQQSWSRSTAAREEVLARTNLGWPFLTRMPCGRGQAFIFNTSAQIGASNLTRHALWIPLLLRMAERSFATPVHTGEIGHMTTWNLPLPNDINNIELKGPLDSFGDSSIQTNAPSWMPEVRSASNLAGVRLQGLDLDAGHYALTQSNMAIAALGLNQDRNESNHEAMSMTSFQEQWKKLGWKNVNVLAATSSTLPQIIQQIEQGTPLWKAFVIFALVALFIETILLRKWKKSSSKE